MKRDVGTSSAIAFIMLLAAILVIATVLAAVVFPNTLHEENEREIQDAITTLTDTKLLMRAAADLSYPQISIYSPLPKGSLVSGDGGELLINGESISLRHLTISPAEDTELGITANGIWRKDGGSAVWILHPTSSYASNTLTLEVLTFEGDIVYGSSESIPFHFAYKETRERAVSDSVVTLTFAGEGWMEDIWQTFFQELIYMYQKKLNAEFVGESLSLSAKSGTMTVKVVEHVYSVRVGDFV